MSSFLANLVGRSFGTMPVVQPRLASRFEPTAEAHQSVADETSASETPMQQIRRQPATSDAGRAQVDPAAHAAQTAQVMRQEGAAIGEPVPTGIIGRQVAPTADTRSSGEHGVSPIRSIEIAERSPLPSDAPVAAENAQQEPVTVAADTAHVPLDKPGAVPEARIEPQVLRPQPVAMESVIDSVAQDAPSETSVDLPSVVVSPETAGDHVPPTSSPGAVRSAAVSPEASVGRLRADRAGIVAQTVRPATAGMAAGAVESEVTDVAAEASPQLIPSDPTPRMQDHSESGHAVHPVLVHTPARDTGPEDRTETVDLMRPAAAGMLPVGPQVSPRSVHKPAEPTPTIRVTIGRIEVRAETETPPPTRRTSRPSPRVSLDDYLRSQDRRQR